MKIVNFCGVVVAASLLAIAVEYVYGWSNLEPVAEQAGNMVYQWTDGRLGWEAVGDSVSVVEGAADAVESMLRWLGDGPPSASVDGVTVTAVDPAGSTGFRIR